MCAEARHHWLRWVERGLLVVGLAGLTWCSLVWLQATAYQRNQRDALERTLMTEPSRQDLPLTSDRQTLAAGSLIGSLEIPRLRVSAMVAEGDDDSTLRIAIGHLPDTPLPWEDGNSALAAHRDTFFRPLRDIRIGDELRLTTAHEELRYRVRETLVVGPEDVRVLDSTDSPSLTLITCYPFNYVGHAPRRFIVRAEAIARRIRS
jgi:LPXTG-site transpeptidase (sortase) family protein